VGGMTADTDLVRDVLLDGFARIDEGVSAVVDGLSLDDLRWRPDADANPLGWLVWHLTRQQDAQLAHLAGVKAVWSAEGWREKLDLPYSSNAHGYGMSSEDVGKFSVSDPGLLTGYQSATRAAAAQIIEGFTADDYHRVIDESWDPPVTIAVRAYSVLEDAAKHLGQAEYLRGLIERK
jgi:hypothetical protein